ncbi:methionine--tRNA ligase [Aureibacter tunicatorum]|uniref:Methionine--tRNA ligase n=1 Tax=Aureibacter tunicatorum TaxID=866807 RepID=A0AAE4BS62_9BACT|nr:methionine--tRNA ligase [Aureibacter tunicatorum]MDR6239426.1 methionyl-tRNA synthetase [Aureibacter tunicatorum]BDD04651.1 methionine--tRNA ligase [Aureibacter tunicatorum]
MSEKNIKRYTITAALPYTNGPVHIGHLAGVYVPADIYARYKRSMGEDVAFVCGSDEHGVPITIRAKKDGITPQQLVDKYNAIIRDSFDQFGISFDIYSRTSSKTHHDTASEFFKYMHENGDFIEQTTEQYYDEEAKQFLADRYITGTCPKCGAEGAYGDQCEVCGSSLSATELINPKSALSGAAPVLKETKHWYLPLDQYEPWLKDWILEQHKNDWKSNVYGQCKSWLDQGLQPRAVTRDLDWGVPVPVEGADGKVLYVWFDAPIGYISATKDWATKAGKDWEPYWKSNDSKLVHFIGKDNIVFHCIIFPSMLKAHGGYILPDNVPANEFLNLEGNKISTSRNWAVWLHEYLEDLPNKQDVLRYTLCANAPETKDNDFTWKDFQQRNNSELVAIFGNFVNRSVVLTHKYYNGKVPSVNKLEPIDHEVISAIKELPAKIGKSIDLYRFREALQYMMELARIGNKYLADTEPWKLIKTDEESVETIMNLSLQISANLSILCEPFLPFTADKLRSMLNMNKANWSEAGSIELLDEGHAINKAELLFEKLDDKFVDTQIQKLEDTKKANELAQKTVEPQKEETTFDDFMKMDIRVGEILEAEKLKKSKKLLKLTVDTGIDKRTILSGIAQYFSPEDVIGKQVVVLANLAPRKMMGHESQGMILMAEDKDGSLTFVSPSDAVANGSQIS